MRDLVTCQSLSMAAKVEIVVYAEDRVVSHAVTIETTITAQEILEAWRASGATENFSVTARLKRLA